MSEAVAEAVGFGLKARSDYAAPGRPGRHLADVATGFGVVGVALAAAAVVVYVTAPRDHGVAVAPTATASSLGLVIGGRF